MLRITSLSVVVLINAVIINGYVIRPSGFSRGSQCQLQAWPLKHAWTSAVVGTVLLVGGVAQASEIGIEVEAPTLFTGETVMICKKRGPLGACLETVRRTTENDNDKAQRYYQDLTGLTKKVPSEVAIEAASIAPKVDEGNGNELIQRLKRQSEENREKNDLYVQQKTFENDQSAIFGPFDRQVAILNTDGKSFSILPSPQAMRLKKAGFIEGRQFVKQPSPEELEAALPAEGSPLTDAFSSLFGSSSDTK